MRSTTDSLRHAVRPPYSLGQANLSDLPHMPGCIPARGAVNNRVLDALCIPDPRCTGRRPLADALYTYSTWRHRGVTSEHAAEQSVDHWPMPHSARFLMACRRGQVMPHWSCLPLHTQAFNLRNVREVTNDSTFPCQLCTSLGLHALIAGASRTPGVTNPLGHEPWVTNPFVRSGSQTQTPTY